MGTSLCKLATANTTRRIIGAAIDVHRYLRPGMLERLYELCLEAGLRKRGLRVERQVPVPVLYLDVELDCAFRIDNVNVYVLAVGGWKRVLRER